MHLVPDNFRLLLKMSGFYMLVFLTVVILISGSFVMYFGYQTYNLALKYGEIQEGITSLEDSVQRIQQNKNNLEPDIDTLNAGLKNLVPETESYFAVVSALEKLVQNTGVHMTSYNLDIENTNESALGLQVQIEADTNSLRHLLESYEYAGGRLITCDTISLRATGSYLVQMNLRFYHAPYRVESHSEVIS